jgi:hypothetical protein
VLAVGTGSGRSGSEVGDRIRSNGHGCAATGAVSIDNLWEVRDAKIREAEN